MTTSIEALAALAGTDLGESDWIDVTQGSVDAFAELTGDRQWIHTDPARATATPFGGTIVHGYMTLALAPALLAQVLPLDSFGMAINYGLDKLRFPAPLPVGSQVRMHARLDAVTPLEGGAQLNLTLTMEASNLQKPVCVAAAVYRVYEVAA